MTEEDAPFYTRVVSLLEGDGDPLASLYDDLDVDSTEGEVPLFTKVVARLERELSVLTDLLVESIEDYSTSEDEVSSGFHGRRFRRKEPPCASLKKLPFCGHGANDKGSRKRGGLGNGLRDRTVCPPPRGTKGSWGAPTKGARRALGPHLRLRFGPGGGFGVNTQGNTPAGTALLRLTSVGQRDDFWAAHQRTALEPRGRDERTL
ncbi:uncharacterized protein LOC116573397 isoform X6 [Mustela erminea]|uniref:uncharacterized protein LOC116573397 isoform X6 n=1 Tax=Mustela erminea TaxID=36723 RepID=UPI0013874716|nr:uncharacterized protein LOC116573397 isoform X6 [Mustela erminea]